MSVPSPDIPIVAVHNNLETFFEFLKRADDPDLVRKRKNYGDRGLFWLGDPKLLFVTAPVPDAPAVCHRWGYNGTTVLAPSDPTHQLSLDILKEPELVNRIVEYAGAGRTIQMIPYATTAEFLQLAETLRTRYRLTVFLPESPAPERLWLRDFVDTKSGFRDLAAQCIPAVELIPPGFVCQNISQAASAADWFLGRGEGCVVKANGGKSGLGQVIFAAGNPQPQSVLEALRQNPFLQTEIIIVEKYVHSSAQLSPSLEFFVPPQECGRPQVTYVSKQLFSSFGYFAGVLLEKNLERASWYPLLAECGLKIADYLQKMGYVGHFDLDTIIDDSDHPNLLEINARRTGGTYVHEFARFTFGPDYLKRVALLSINAMSSGGITRLDALLERLSDLLYPGRVKDTGVIVTMTSTLAAGEFGCILVAPTEAAVLELNGALLERIRSYSVKTGGS